jgi:GT2 family glycosyltransferase
MANKLVSIIIPTYNRETQVLNCITSFCNSNYPAMEIIVVDNASTDNTVLRIKKEFPHVQVIEMEKNLGASGGRNAGIVWAKGDYLCFADSDNTVDRELLNELVNLAESDQRIGFVGPKVYYAGDPKRIWYAGANINLLTSKTKYIGINLVDNGQYATVREVGHIPNLWLAKREIIDEIGLIDTDYVMHYEESDWAMRAARAGYKIMFCPSAVAYHNVDLPGSKGLRSKIGFESKYRIFYAARNRVLFMRKYASSFNFILFLLIFNNIFLFQYCLIFFRHKRLDLVGSYLRGYFNGLAWVIRSII